MVGTEQIDERNGESSQAVPATSLCSSHETAPQNDADGPLSAGFSSPTGCLEQLEPMSAAGWVAFPGKDPSSIDVVVRLDALTLATGSPFIQRDDVEMHLLSVGPHGFHLAWSFADLKHIEELLAVDPDRVSDLVVEARCEGFVWNLAVLPSRSRTRREWRDYFSVRFVDSATIDTPGTPFFGALESVGRTVTSGWVVPKSNDSGACVVSMWIDDARIIEQTCELANRPDVAAAVDRPWIYAFSLRPSVADIGKALSRLLALRKGDASGIANFSCRVGWSSGLGISGNAGLCEFRIPSGFVVTRTLLEWIEFFGLELSSDLLANRLPVYRKIAHQIARDGDDQKYSEIDEFYRSSMTFLSRSESPTFRTSRVTLVERHFDVDFYLSKYGADPKVAEDPVEHYLSIGAAADHDPHPLFSNSAFRRSLALRHNAKPEDNDPFAHFLKHHAFIEADPHPMFSTAWYKHKYSLPDHWNPWVDYVEGGWNFGREPNWLFLQELVEEATERTSETVSPLETYLNDDACAEITPHPMFPSSWKRSDYIRYFSGNPNAKEFATVLFDRSNYLSQVESPKLICGSAFADYFAEGELNERSPNVLFNPIWYRRAYGIDSDFLGPFAHYLYIGERLNYQPSRFFDTRNYKEKNNDVVLARSGLAYHFLLRCHAEPSRRACARFDSGWFAANAPGGVADMRSFLNGKLLAPVEPHPALIVSKRVRHSDLVGLLECEEDDQRPLPAGVASVFHFENLERPTRGLVMSEIDRYEAELANDDPDQAQALRLNEPITRMYEMFDDVGAERVRLEVAEICEPRPLVSVIMPARNRVGVISRAINSVLAQTYKNLELIVVDDGSSDGTAVVAAGSGDDRVQVISIKPSGVSAARNVGLQAAKGQYIAYLDSDNTWEKTYLTTLIGTMVSKNLPVAHAALRIFAANGIVRHRGAPYDGESMDRENYIDMNVFVHHRRIIDEGVRFDETLLRCVDWDFIRRSCLEVGPSSYVPVIGCNYLDDDRLGRITTDELQGDFFRLCLRQVNLAPHVTGIARKRKPTFSLIWPVHRSEESVFLRTIWTAVRHMRCGRHELIIVANGLSDNATRQLAAMSRRINGMRVIHLWRSFHFFPATMLARRLTLSDRFLLWNGHIQYDSAAIESLMNSNDPAPLEFPLVLDQAGAILPGYFTVSRDGADILDVGSEQKLPKLREKIFSIGSRDFPVSVSREHFDRLGGFDTDYAIRLGLLDLVTRSLTENARSVVLRTDCILRGTPQEIDLLNDRSYLREREKHQRASILPVGIAPSLDSVLFKLVKPMRQVKIEGGIVLSKPSKLRVVSTPKRTGGLRIDIRCPAPDDHTTKHWGDWHFANSLATAFQANGQTATVRLRPAWSGPVTGIDVALHIRGIVDIAPVPNALNVIWIISHPDKIRSEELEAVDLVISSSQILSDHLYKRFGVSSVVLPQATDSQRFNFKDELPRMTLQDRLLFIGNSRKYPRRIVLDAVQSGAPLDIYGGDWEYYVPRRFIRGSYVPNQEVAGYYRSAAAVLNDHWPTMARAGIISNRIFDAIAAGGVVISDEVEGIGKLFDGHVRTCADARTLNELISGLPDWAPSLEARKKMSAQILAEHSFDARARQIAALIHDL